MKKIPSVFRKKYTAKKLEKKLLKKLYIQEDKKYVKELFSQVDKKGKKQVPVYAISEAKLQQLEKKDGKKLKLLAKQIKKQKGRINFVPLVVSLAFIAAIIVSISIFKNLIVKKAIQVTCENIFEAKCDIGSVDFRFFDSSLKIEKIEIANKDDVMKNLIDIGSIDVDFDLLQLLKRKFVADNLSMLDVNSGTDRKTSGELSLKEKNKRQKQKEKIVQGIEDSKFGKIIKEKKETASVSLEKNITGLFNQFNPETLMKSYSSQLKTPALAQEVQEKVPQIIEKWQSKPEEIQKTVNALQESVNEIASFDFNSIQNNPLKIKNFIDNLNSTYKNIEKVKNDANSVLNNFNADIAEVDGLRRSIQTAVTHDMNFATAEINKIKSLNLSDGIKLISGLVENVAYDVLGKYYPYAEKGIDYLLELRKNQSGKASEKEKEKKVKKEGYSVYRASGRSVLYKQDKVPSFWIKKMAGSGPIFYAKATDISNNQDLIDKPAKIEFNMDLWDLQHTAKLVVDFRTKTEEPLFRADYGLKNIPLNIPAEKFGAYPGVPSFDAKCAVDAVLKIFDNKGFEIAGDGVLTNLKITTLPFEPEYASKIYSNVMSRINTVSAGLSSSFDFSSGLRMNIKTDADTQIFNSLKKEMEAQFAGIKETLKAELTKRINEASNGAFGNLGSLDDIKNKLTSSITTANGFESILTQKLNEIEKQNKGKAGGSVNDPAEKVKNELTNQLKKLF